MTTDTPAPASAPVPRRRTSVTETMDNVARMQQAAATRAGGLTGRSKFPDFGGVPGLQPSTSATEPSAENRAQRLVASADPATDRDIRVLKLSTIHSNPFQPREVYTSESIRDRALSIKADGQYDLIHVIPHPDIPGEFMIGDGWTRVTGCIEYEVVDALAAEVHHNKTPLEAAWMGFEQNEQREQFCDLDKAFFFDKLYTEGQTQEYVEKRTGISQSRLSFYASFKKLEPQILEVVRTNGTRFSAFLIPHLVKVSTKVSPEKALSLALSFSTGEQSTRWFIEQCAALLDKQKKKPAAPGKSGRVIRFNNGSLKEKNGKFDLSLAVAPERRDEFSAALEALLAQYGETVSDQEHDTNAAKADQ